VICQPRLLEVPPQWTDTTTYDSGETSVADSSGRYYFVYYIFPTGLFFARFKKTQSRKKLAQKKNSRQNFAKKKLKVPESPQYFTQKTQDFFTIRHRPRFNLFFVIGNLFCSKWDGL